MRTCVNWDRDPDSHWRRRALWDRALGTKAQVAYAPWIARLAEVLVDRLGEARGRPTSVNKWCHFLAFDVMGEICFGRNYGQSESGRMHHMVRVIGKYMRVGVYATMVPWLHCAVSRLWAPDWLVAKPDWMFNAFTKEELVERQGTGGVEGAVDVVQVLGNERGKGRVSDREMVLNTLIMTVGGSDTTNSALLHCLYRLAKHASVQANVYEEVKGMWRTGRSLDANMVADMSYTTAVILESLIIHPSTASGLPRVVPAGGVMIDGVHIPGGTNVITPTYAIQRDERYFMETEKFIPERWTTMKWMMKDPRAFCPFGKGAYGCPRRALAMMEMKIVLASLLSNFEVRKAKEEQWSEIDRRVHEEWKDCLTTQTAQVELCFCGAVTVDTVMRRR